MIINEVRFENRIIELCSSNIDDNRNTFTIVIGRNGHGKSTLLQKICQIVITSLINKSHQHHPNSINDLIDYHESKELSSLDETGSLNYTTKNNTHKIIIQKQVFIPPNINLSEIPEHLHESIINSLQNKYLGPQNIQVGHYINEKINDTNHTLPKIIAVSSSPFDKFPLLDDRRINHTINSLKDHYVYRGARTKNNSNKSYMRSKFDQLGASFIDFFLKPEKRTNEILPLFSYLGIKTKFTVILKFPFHFSLNEIGKSKEDSVSELIKRAKFFKNLEPEISLSKEDEFKIRSSIKTLQEGLYSSSGDAHHNFHLRDEVFSIHLDINDLNSSEPQFLKEFAVLAQYDLVDLANIEFTKEKNERTFFLTEASSGELCILFNILAIAGSISDQSIVLLDEPELSLHPEWQRDFLPLLEKVFSQYKQCHFILATHSPHIVSSIPLTNSFVVNLEDDPAKSFKGDSFSLKSSDYQLAETFNSPGYRNEYLISQLIEVLSQLSDGKKLDNVFINKINNLIEFDSLIVDDDPVKKLLSTLKKALEVLLK